MVGTSAHFSGVFFGRFSHLLGLGFGDASDFVFGDELFGLELGLLNDEAGLSFGIGNHLGCFGLCGFEKGGRFFFGAGHEAFGFSGEAGGVFHFPGHRRANLFNLETEVFFFESEGDVSEGSGAFDFRFEVLEESENINGIV